MSYYVRKVVINLHSSFVNPQRTCERPPYEVTECGWGEFEIIAKVHFIDPNERPIELRHWLRLYPPGIENYDTYRPPEGSPNCVATEMYDEIIFNDPSERFFEILMGGPLNPPIKYSMEEFFPKTHGKEEYLAGIMAARQTVNQNIEAARTKAVNLTLEIVRLKEIYYAVHEEKAITTLNREAEVAQQQESPTIKKEAIEAPPGTVPHKVSVSM